MNRVVSLVRFIVNVLVIATLLKGAHMIAVMIYSGSLISTKVELIHLWFIYCLAVGCIAIYRTKIRDGDI